MLDDNLVGRAAELGFFFIFALFPSLFTATAILGLAARSASEIYYTLLGYLAIVIPHSAMGTVLETFNQTTIGATSGKLTFGLFFAIWSASVGFSAIQDSLNVVYRVKETRSYLAARLSAIGVTIILMILVTLMLATMFGTDLFVRLGYLRIEHHFLATTAALVVRVIGWSFVAMILSLFFAVIYYFAPNVKSSQWHWLTSWRNFRDCRLAYGINRLPNLLAFFQQLLGSLWGFGSRDHSSHLVLSHRLYASSGRRDQ
jgi:membrane protein